MIKINNSNKGGDLKSSLNQTIKEGRHGRTVERMKGERRARGQEGSRHSKESER